jgi:ribosomal subunit interface protein
LLVLIQPKRRSTMQVHVHYQGLASSKALEEFIANKSTKLQRYLGPASSVELHLKYDHRTYQASMAIHGIIKDYAFTAPGENLYEAFASVLDKAMRTLGEQKRKHKDKINRKFYSLKKDLVA